jgi:hypothetical protein
MGRGQRGQQARQGPPGPPGQPGRPRQPAQPPQPPQPRASQRRESPRRPTGGRSSGSPLHNYQAIIAAEFIGAELLVAIGPVAAQKPQPTQTSGGKSLSPYRVNDLVKLWAIGVVYLILMGLAAGSQGRGRFSAWFGFLILIAVGLSELSRLADIFATLAGARVQDVALTGTQAPATKGTAAVPPLVPGGTPPPPGKKAAANG